MKKLVLAAAAITALPASANAATIFAVDENNNLVTFNSANPGTFTSSKAITGTNETFLTIDFRDSNNKLYGLTDAYGLYTINTMNGVASLIASNLPLLGTNFGFDFNTVVDMIRVVGNFDDNYVVNPDTGSVSQFTDVAYGAGDPNAGRNAMVLGNAYIHGTTTQYAVETNADTLVRQDNNNGTLSTIGSLNYNIGPRASFDIGYDGVAYLQDVDTFHTVNLSTGAATFVGSTPTALYAISAAVPEPATWAMLLFGFGAIGFMVRRKSRTTVNVAYA